MYSEFVEVQAKQKASDNGKRTLATRSIAMKAHTSHGVSMSSGLLRILGENMDTGIDLPRQARASGQMPPPFPAISPRIRQRLNPALGYAGRILEPTWLGLIHKGQGGINPRALAGIAPTHFNCQNRASHLTQSTTTEGVRPN